MLNEEKWLGITQSFQNLRGESTQAPPVTNPTEPPHGIPVPEKSSADVVCNKENDLSSNDENGRRKEMSKIPSSASARVKVNKSHFTKSLLHLPPNGISGIRRKLSPELPHHTKTKNAVEMETEKVLMKSRRGLDPIPKYLDSDLENAEGSTTTRMEAQLRELNRRFLEKSRQVEEQKLIISELRTKLMISTVGLSETEYPQADIAKAARSSDPSGNNSAEPSDLNQVTSVQMERVTKADVILLRLTKLEDKMEALIQTLPEKIEAMCLKILNEGMNGVKGKAEKFGESNVTGTQAQYKWNLAPTIKPKSNLATKLRMNFKGGGYREPNDPDVEQKIKVLENTVDQLKNSMFMMMLKARYVN